jgi:2-polyprenyl-3-methyl-5-hydroxy-6-metoxy-1,4-benzoquinol methylase
MKNIPKYFRFITENRSHEQATLIFNQRISDSLHVYEKFSSDFKDRPCPICGHSEKKELEKFHATYSIKECSFCMTQYVSPSPTKAALTYYYNECKCNAMFGELLRTRHNTQNTILSERVSYTLSLITKQLESKGSLKILEIGCNSGTFLSELKQGLLKLNLLPKCQLEGIDIDKTAINKNVDPSIKLFSGDIDSFSNDGSKKYDLLIHFELIEHLESPFEFMRSAFQLLNSGGVHHFHTPNANGLDHRALGYNSFRALAHGIFPPMHLQAFTPQNIMHFAIRSGFKLLEVDTPGNFDVDLVKEFLPKSDINSPYHFIKDIPEEYLAVFQHWLKLLNASSHMRCTLIKP